MRSIRYQWADGDLQREWSLAYVRGTNDSSYVFGDLSQAVPVCVSDFFIGTIPVTQAFWRHITGTESPALHRGADLPVENVSWNAVVDFVRQLNQSTAVASLREQTGLQLVARLPTETEWEYAARGGVHWGDQYQYSGSNDIDNVAWYNRLHGDWTQPVAQKAPNQLGIYDMSGNVWEWCEDTFSPDLSVVPTDGTAYMGPGDERVLRGGCFHNWAVHCTVTKRYEISHLFHDGCIGFRLVMAVSRRSARGDT